MSDNSQKERPACLVTGGARRLGAAIVRSAAARFDVAIHYNASADEAAALAADVEAQGARAELVAADLADADEAASLVHQVRERMGRLDLVVNNASVFEYDSPSDFSAERMHGLLAVNLVAPLVIAREFARVGSADATLINMLDNKVFAPNPDFFSYSLGKMALNDSIAMLALNYRGRLRVCGIAPSVTLLSGSQTEENFARSWRHTLTGQGPSPEDIAAAVDFIWSTKSLNGEVIVLDGGQRLMSLERDVAFVVE